MENQSSGSLQQTDRHSDRLGGKGTAYTSRYKICSYCAQLYPRIEVALRIRARVGDILFNHGACINHMYEMYKGNGIPEDQIRASLSKMDPASAPPDLRLPENESLRKQLEKGIFTQEDLQKSQQSSNLTERFKKLAGIRS